MTTEPACQKGPQRFLPRSETSAFRPPGHEAARGNMRRILLIREPFPRCRTRPGAGSSWRTQACSVGFESFQGGYILSVYVIRCKLQSRSQTTSADTFRKKAGTSAGQTAAAMRISGLKRWRQKRRSECFFRQLGWRPDFANEIKALSRSMAAGTGGT